MKLIRWSLGVFVGLALMGFAAHLLLRPNFDRVDFTSLGEHLGPALVKPVIRNMDGSAVTTIDPRFAIVYSRAGEIGIAVARHNGQLPVTSHDLSEIAPENRVDPWGNPFCLADLGDRILVASGGQTGIGAGCSQLQKEIGDLQGAKVGLLYRSSKGALVLLVSRASAKEATTQASWGRSA